MHERPPRLRHVPGALADLCLSIPQDVSVVSFGNDELASCLRPGLTTVELPHEAMGRTSIGLILDHNRRPDCHRNPMPVIERGPVHPPWLSPLTTSHPAEPSAPTAMTTRTSDTPSLFDGSVMN
ncbi:substrate-binding domain-containing protein [Streptomyces pseudoechinosporeus]